ncbi:MAG: hypothetical protein HUU46_08495 [Candidatus Hydrogenedentes bacterium]|nr:hypothetical protein [Candidatus Hydrogenedentota bacterium]
MRHAILAKLVVGFAVVGLAALAAEMAPIDIKLPQAYFGGTPLNYPGEHLEESTGLPREPFSAPKGAAVLSQGKPVTSSSANPTFGKLSMITDGEKGYQQEFLTELAPGTQWVQIDLGEPCEIYAIVVWHFHQGERVYYDFVVRTADDADFKTNVQKLYNNDFDNSSGLGVGNDKEYIESNEGRLVSALRDGKGTLGRYVRLYSKGNTTDDANHYVEVEVWGKPRPKK